MPLSPSIRAVALVGATFSIMRQTRIIDSLDCDDACQGHPGLLADQGPVLRLEIVDLVSPLHDEAQHVHVDRLLIEVIGSLPDRFDRIVTVELSGDDDDLGVRCQLQDL